MENVLQTYSILALAVFIYMSCWFIVAVIKERNDVADIAWGLGFMFCAWLSLYINDSVNIVSLLSSTLVSVWAIRLSTHIYLRNRGKTEDYRYKTWREQWGSWFYIRTFLQVFLLQGLLMLIVVSPAVITNSSYNNTIGYLSLIGTIVWVVGFFFESVGDFQLSRFIKNPDNKGKVMRYGLWKYTRHPNYFGEVTQWWGIWLIALQVPYGIYGIIGPLTITFLILKVSGIPLLENKMRENPEFAEYIKKTSMFFPLPVKK